MPLTRLGCLHLPSEEEIKQIAAEIKKTAVGFPDTDIFWKDQIFQLVLVYYLLLDLDNLGNDYGAWTCGALGTIESILLAQRITGNIRGFCFHRSDPIAKKTKCISGLYHVLAQACGGVSSVSFITGNTMAFIKADPNKTFTPAWFAFGSLLLAGEELFNLLENKEKPEGFHGNKRLSHVVGILRNLSICLGTFQGLVTSLSWNPNVWPLAVRDSFLGSMSTFPLLLKMTFDGVLYGPHRNESLLDKIKIVAGNLVNNEALATSMVFLSMSYALFEENNTIPMGSFVGTVALACLSNAANVTESVVSLASKICKKGCCTKAEIYHIIKGLEFFSLLTAHSLIGADAIMATANTAIMGTNRLIGPTRYPIIVAGTEIVGAFSDLFSTRSTSANVSIIILKLILSITLLFYALLSENPYTVSIIAFGLIRGLAFMTRATQPRQSDRVEELPGESEKRPLLGGDVSVNGSLV